jgi:hypothetical protein
MSDPTLIKMLGDIKSDVGEMKGMLSLHIRAFDAHVEADAKVDSRLQAIELHVAGHRGAAKLAALVATVLGSLAGLLSAIAHAHFWGNK